MFLVFLELFFGRLYEFRADLSFSLKVTISACDESVLSLALDKFLLDAALDGTRSEDRFDSISISESSSMSLL